MKPKSTLILDNEFIQYCELNKIDNVDKLAQETFNRGFSLLKYGETPTGNRTKEIVEVTKEVIKEVIVEVEKIVERIVEVPIEVIREVIKEVIVEVPVEIIKEVFIEKKGKNKTITKEVIKEVPVEKIVEVIKEVVNNDEIERLIKENNELKFELEKITSSLNKLGKGKLMRNSDLGSLYDE
jgi:hypothetical protein